MSSTSLAHQHGAEYVSIGMLSPVVSVTGETGGQRWTLWTYDTPETFDWSLVDADVPVLDHRTAPEYNSSTGPSMEAYSRGDWPEVVALARANGIKTETVADYRRVALCRRECPAYDANGCVPQVCASSRFTGDGWTCARKESEQTEEAGR